MGAAFVKGSGNKRVGQGMKLLEILAPKKTSILNKWYQAILETYPPETAKFLREERDQFANPVGYTLYEGIEGLYGELLKGFEAEKLYPFLDKIVRIRAVQDFSPSQAIAVIFLLKAVIRGEVREELQEGVLSWKELLEFEARIDDLASQAFDIYMQCREQLYEIRVKEIKTRVSRLLQRANLHYDL